MTLAGMLIDSEDELIADFATIYHIYDYKRLPVETLAALAFALSKNYNARVTMKACGIKVPFDTYLEAVCADRMAGIMYMFADEKKRGKPPASIADELMVENPKDQKSYAHFESGKDFEEERKKYLR